MFPACPRPSGLIVRPEWRYRRILDRFLVAGLAAVDPIAGPVPSSRRLLRECSSLGAPSTGRPGHTRGLPTRGRVSLAGGFSRYGIVHGVSAAPISNSPRIRGRT